MNTIATDRTGIRVGGYRWTPRRMRRPTWQMTLTKLVCAPVAGAAVVVALIGWGQPYVMHQDYTQGGVPIVEVKPSGR
jgi:hypothetical protein